MEMIKKTMLLAMAAAALVAFMAPAGASAEGMFFHEGNPIEEPIEEEFSGSFGFASGLGGISCGTHPVVEIDTNGGTVLDLGITTSTCIGSGAFAGCTITSHKMDEPLPTLTPTASTIDINGLVVTYTYGGSCPLSGTSATHTFKSPLVATPNNPEAISTLSLSGVVTIDSALGALSVTASGAFEAANPETVGLKIN
jgi:hypothetical protein